MDQSFYTHAYMDGTNKWTHPRFMHDGEGIPVTDFSLTVIRRNNTPSLATDFIRKGVFSLFQRSSVQGQI